MPGNHNKESEDRPNDKVDDPSPDSEMPGGRNEESADQAVDNGDDPSLDSEAIKSIQDAFGVSEKKAREILKRFKGTVKKMKDLLQR